MTTKAINLLCYLLALATFACGTSCATAASSEESRIAKVELQPSDAMIGAIRFEGFPALSKDGSEFAILRHDDGMKYSASFVILRRSDAAVMKKFPLLDEAQGGAGSDASAVTRLAANLVPINTYLASKSFVAMAPLYTLPDDRDPSLIQQFVSAGRRFTFNRRSGALSIHALRSNDEVLRLQRPRLVQTARDLHPHNACVLDAVPTQGWINARNDLVVVRIDYLSSKDCCYEPEAWIVETIP